jgi:WD40 repeat protein
LRQIIAAKFDPAGHWLAFIRDNHLSVWQTAKRPESLYLEADVPNAVTLGFDQTGTLLFVGTSDKITIWDVANKTIVAEYDTPRLASLAISEDNRLLIWGDAWGKVHIWGAHR